MAQQTALSTIATPGRVLSFSAKTEFVPAAVTATNTNVFTVAAEDRVFMVAVEGRVFTVLAESRTFYVKEIS